MEKQLGDLLEELDRYYPSAVSIQSLIQDSSFSEILIKETLDKELITSPYNMKDLLDKAKKGNKTIPVIISAKGFTILNQIRLKKVTEKLDLTIRNFNKSSNRFANIMIGLAIATLLLTGVIAWLTSKLA